MDTDGDSEAKGDADGMVAAHALTSKAAMDVVTQTFDQPAPMLARLVFPSTPLHPTVGRSVHPLDVSCP